MDESSKNCLIFGQNYPARLSQARVDVMTSIGIIVDIQLTALLTVDVLSCI